MAKKKGILEVDFFCWLMPQPNGLSSHTVGIKALEFTAASFWAHSSWESRDEGKERYRYRLDGERKVWVEDCEGGGL